MEKNILIAFGLITLMLVLMIIFFIVFVVIDEQKNEHETDSRTFQFNNLLDWKIFATGS